jgi:uracil-DNA glycosylase family 4
VSDDLRDLLSDLAAYLDQQRALGSTFYLEGDVPAPDPQPAVAAPAPAPAAPAAETTARPEPKPASAAKAPAPAPAAAASPSGDAFAQECAAFVADTLGLIAREQAAPPPVDAVADKAAALEALADRVRSCSSCALHAGRQQAVPGTGNPDAGLVLIGEAPGAEEDRKGLPFVGRSGQLLTDILKAIGFARDDVFICNILKCRPPNNRDPEAPEVAACEPHLKEQLRIIRPRVILCLGRIAAQTLLGTTASLGSLRRSVHFYEGVPVMATYHPAALLRNPGNKRDTWDDVRKLRALHDALAGGAD